MEAKSTEEELVPQACFVCGVLGPWVDKLNSTPWQCEECKKLPSVDGGKPKRNQTHLKTFQRLDREGKLGQLPCKRCGHYDCSCRNCSRCGRKFSTGEHEELFPHYSSERSECGVCQLDSNKLTCVKCGTEKKYCVCPRCSLCGNYEEECECLIY